MAGRTIENYQFETGVYRPPSEGGSYSLLVRFTRNCPWNHCTFCGMYKDHRFEIRTPDQIKQDINAMAALCSDLKEISLKHGQVFAVSREAVNEIIRQVPELNYHQGFIMVLNWLQSGAKTAFIQDANSLIMKTDPLVDALQYLRKTFPSINRVTTYARSKTIVRKTLKDLAAIHAAGLDRLHVGLESGDDILLKKIRKGVTAEEHIKGGQKALAAGFQLSEYWMPGLGGKALTEKHAVNTARVLSAINPHYIRSRPLHPWPGTPLSEEFDRNEVEMLSSEEQLLELKQMIETLDVTSKVCFDHAANYWKDRQGRLLFSHSYEGYQFPEQKPQVLARIEEGLKAGNTRPSFLQM
jgi:radical SAM superfamily enzyme YgiQ (UPF0313 family)